VPGSAFVAALLAGVAAFAAPALAAPGDIANRAGSGAVFPDTGAFSGDGGAATRAVLRHPSDVDALPGGGFVVTDSEHERIRVVAPDGTIATLAGDGRKCEQATAACGDGGPATAASLNVPHGVAALPGGGVLVADTFTNRVRAVAPDGTIRTVAGDGRPCVPATGCGDGGPATAAQLTWPTAAVPLPGGGMLVADHGAGRVRLVHDGVISTVAGWEPGYAGDGGPGLDARFRGIADVALLPGGAVLVADGDNCRLRLVTPDGMAAPFAGTGTPGACASVSSPLTDVGDGGPATAARINVPGYVGVDGDGAVYLTDVYSNRVRRIGPQGVIATVAGTGEAVGHAGDGGPATQARLAWPSGLAVAPDALLFTDSGNNRVRAVERPGLRAAAVPSGPGARAALAVIAATASADARAVVLRVVCPPEPLARRCAGAAGVEGAPAAPVDLAAGEARDVPAPVPAGTTFPATLRAVTTTRQASGASGTQAREVAVAAPSGDGARGTTPGGRSAGRTATGARDLASSAALPTAASPAAPPRRAPAAVLAVLRRPLAIAARRRLRVPVTCPAGAPRACRGTLAARTAPRVRCAGRTRALPLGAARFALAPGATRGVRLPVPAATARCLRGRRVPALLTAPGLRLRVSVRALSPQRASRRRR